MEDEKREGMERVVRCLDFLGSAAPEPLPRKRLQREAERVDFVKVSVRHGSASGRSTSVQVAKRDTESENGPIIPPKRNRHCSVQGRVQPDVYGHVHHTPPPGPPLTPADSAGGR